MHLITTFLTHLGDCGQCDGSSERSGERPGEHAVLHSADVVAIHLVHWKRFCRENGTFHIRVVSLNLFFCIVYASHEERMYYCYLSTSDRTLWRGPWSDSWCLWHWTFENKPDEFWFGHRDCGTRVHLRNSPVDSQLLAKNVVLSHKLQTATHIWSTLAQEIQE
jgi:hypothetical protein